LRALCEVGPPNAASKAWRTSASVAAPRPEHPPSDLNDLKFADTLALLIAAGLANMINWPPDSARCTCAHEGCLQALALMNVARVWLPPWRKMADLI